MSVQPRSSRPRRTLSWLGLAAILGGLTLIWLYFDSPHLTKNPSPVYGMTYLGTGCVLILWGLRALAGEIAGLFGRWRNRPARQYRVSMPREAFIYGLILLVLCAGALLGRSNMLMLVFGLMAGPFVLNGQVTLGILRRLKIQRSLPEHATVGENFSVKLSLSNHKHLLSSWMVSAEDIVHTPHEQLQPAVLFACVPSRSTRDAVYEIRPAHRGLHEFGPVRVMSRFPLGLMERSIDLGLVERFVVYPRIGRLKPRWRHAAATGELASEQARTGHSASDDEFHRLREYRSGDNPRTIHWRTTARRNELMVREFQHGRSQDLLLAVDLWLPASGFSGPNATGRGSKTLAAEIERVELAVSFAASICVDHVQSATDSTIELIVSGRDTQRATASSGVASMGGLLERLALAQAGPAAGLAGAIRDAAGSAQGQLRQVLITTRPRNVLEAALVAQSESTALCDTSNFEIIEADPEVLAAWLEFDLSELEGPT
jgi:uncharacterized protein (DUF58 family)